MKVFLFLLVLSCASGPKPCEDASKTEKSCTHKQKKFPKRDELGAWNYCTEKYGYILGKSGITRLEDCPEHLKAMFLKGYSEGRKEHSLHHFKESQDTIKKGT